VCREHGFVLWFRRHEGYFFAFPKTFVPFALSGLTELGLLTRTVDADGAHFDAHEPRRHLHERELLPLKRIPFHGSYILGPAQPEVALDRMYGDLASAAVMSSYQAPRIAPSVADFWRKARPVDGALDWERISRRFRNRKRSVGFHLAQVPCAAWHVVNRSHWIATDVLRSMAGGERGS
jgi:hypothetical protein